jgi:hypothetical protein
LVPLAYLSYNGQGKNTYQDENDETNVATSMLTIEYSVLAYAVAYPTFQGSGAEIWHDPTFNVFITFAPKYFWGLFLVIGSITLAAVAASKIAKKKEQAMA